jgi:hypothetical protein
MNHLCSTCNVCAFMPEQKVPRVASINNTEHPAFDTAVLVIDDAQNQLDQYDGMKWMGANLLPTTPFTYTSTIRCEHDVTEISGDQLLEAVEKCSVWTHQLLEDRAVILTTETGLHQLQLGEKRKRGDMFVHGRLGVVLVIPPVALFITNPGLTSEYKPRIQRVLKEVGL